MVKERHFERNFPLLFKWLCTVFLSMWSTANCNTNISLVYNIDANAVRWHLFASLRLNILIVLIAALNKHFK